jgi:hypothetical protein
MAAVAMAKRTKAWNTGGTSATVALSSTCWKPPEHAAGQQQGDGEGVEVGFAGGAHRLIMVK